eukprot:3937040-Rhodomonas_salina.1
MSAVRLPAGCRQPGPVLRRVADAGPVTAQGRGVLCARRVAANRKRRGRGREEASEEKERVSHEPHPQLLPAPSPRPHACLPRSALLAEGRVLR